MAIKTPPIPTGGPDEMARVSHTRLRRRLLYSEFEGDLRARLKTNIGGVRQAAWGTPDLTANPYLTMWSGASALYDEEPIVRAPQGSGALFDTVAETGFFAQQQRVMRDTLALREMAVRVDIHGDGALTFRPVFPDMLVLTANPRRPFCQIGNRMAPMSVRADGSGWGATGCTNGAPVDSAQAPTWWVWPGRKTPSTAIRTSSAPSHATTTWCGRPSLNTTGAIASRYQWPTKTPGPKSTR